MIETTVVTSAEPAVRTDFKSSILPCSILVALVLAIYLPVIVWPHWGLFGDYAHVLAARDTFNLHQIEWLQRQWRPGLYLYWLAVWFFSPENPAAYYVGNCGFFVTTVLLTYAVALKLCGSRLFSFCAAAWWLFTPATFEIAYTLDKQEQYMGTTFALFIFCFLTGRNAPAAQGRSIWAALGILLSSTFAFLSKETAVLLIFVGALFVLSDCCPKVKRHELFWSLSTLGITSAVFLICRLSFAALMAKAGYVSVSFEPAYLAQRLTNAIRVFPDFFMLATVSALALFLVQPAQLTRARVDSICLLLATFAGVAGLLAFSTYPGILTYTWFPLYALLLPVVACAATRLSKVTRNSERIARICIVLLFSVAACLQVTGRILEAQAQFKMDTTAQTVAARIAGMTKPDGSCIKVALPFTTIDSIEVSVMLFEYASSHFIEKYTVSKNEQEAMKRLRFYAFLTDGSGSSVLNNSKLSTYLRSKGHSLDENRQVGLSGYTAGRIKVGEYFPYAAGDYMLVPFGNVPLLPYRGLSLFSRPAQDYLVQFPTARFEPIWELKTKVWSFSGKYRMGWALFKCLSVSPITLPVTADGWILDQAPIIYRSVDSGKVLKLRVQNTPPAILEVAGDSDPVRLSPAKPVPWGYEISIPLTGGTEFNQSARRLIITSPNPIVSQSDPRKLLLRLQQMDIE